MNYDFYKENYTGKNVRIAVIDSGIRLPNTHMTHYNIPGSSENDKNKNINTDYTENMHGTFCAAVIKKIAPDSELIDINIADDLYAIQESDIIKAVELCMELDVDIVNLSIKMERFSDELFEKCQEAYSKGIFLIAASDGELSYPADFPDVIKVVSNEQEVEIEELEENFISVKNFIFRWNLFGKDYRLEPSSSLACAFFSGLLSLMIEARPLVTNKEISHQIFKSVISQKTEREQACFKVHQKSVAALSGNAEVLLDNLYLMNKNIMGYFDTDRKVFVDFKGEIISEADYNEILEINPYEYKRSFMTGNNPLDSKNYVHLGIFEEKTEKGYLKNHRHDRMNHIECIKKPVIFICSLGYSSSKFELQLEVYKGLKERNIITENVTYNPLGVLFDFEVYEYPKEVNIPETVYSINHELFQLSKHKEADAILVNIAGGITQLNNHNRNNFGALFFAYKNAVNADAVILTINYGINLERLGRQLEKLKLEDIPEIILVISKKSYDPMLMESCDGVRAIPASDRQQNEFFEEVKTRFPTYKIYRYKDVEDGRLTEMIAHMYCWKK